MDMTILEMGGETSRLLQMAGVRILVQREIPLGVDSLARQCLLHQPPLPGELEHAIEVTEEAVMPLARLFAGRRQLVLKGAGSTLIDHSMQVAGAARMTCSLDEVELLFNRLVAVSQGRPATQEPLPTDVRFFAAMLVLREIMHHLHFSQVMLESRKG